MRLGKYEREAMEQLRDALKKKASDGGLSVEEGRLLDNTIAAIEVDDYARASSRGSGMFAVPYADGGRRENHFEFIYR